MLLAVWIHWHRTIVWEETKVEFRRATREDVAAFAAIRVEFLTLIRTIEDADEFYRHTLDYLYAHIDQDDLLIYLAVDQGKIVSTCMACLFQTAPLPSCITGRSAELLNVYTLSDYRRMGLAETLIRLLIEALQQRGVEKVLLDYTDDGLPLYEKLGFTRLPYEMQLKLPMAPVCDPFR